MGLTLEARTLLHRTGDLLVPYLWPLAVANLVANIGIVVTGGAVRLTSSGLGCPTWPRCTGDRLTPHGELGLHGAIEFGNRMLTVLVTAIAVFCILAAWRSGHGRATKLALGVATVVPAQIVVGGITVLTDLNPWIVAFHMLVSMAIVAICVLLLDTLRGPERTAAPVGFRRLTWLILGVGWVVLWLGTVVTGSGPHSGDLDSRRTGLDPASMSHVHAAVVYLLVALTVIAVVVARRSRLQVPLRAAALLLGVEVAQGAVGLTQYWTGLPELLVGVHLLGAALTSGALTWLVATAQAASSGSSATARKSSVR